MSAVLFWNIVVIATLDFFKLIWLFSGYTNVYRSLLDAYTNCCESLYF